MNMALGHAFNLDQLFANFNKGKLKIKTKQIRKYQADGNKISFIKLVFREFMKLVLNDIVDNNVTLQLPTDSIKSEIRVRRIAGQEFKEARKNGRFKDIDFINSNFSGNELALIMHSREGKPSRNKTIYVSGNLKQKLRDNTNNGKQYC